MNTKERFEPWAWPAFGVLATTLGLLLVMGGRVGGALAVRVYLWGPFAIGGLSAAALLFALLWSLRRRPVLQRGRAWPLAALAASLWLCSLPFPYPSSYEGKPSPVRFRLPFVGEAHVALPFLGGARAPASGDRRATNVFLFDPARRFGTCFEGGAAGLQLVAPVDGSLVVTEPARQQMRLVLEVGPGVFLALEGVVPVEGLAPGTAVRAGMPLGHAPGQLFCFLMDGARPERSEGIPLRYWAYRADGRPVEAGVPIPPQVVAQALDEGSGPGGH